MATRTTRSTTTTWTSWFRDNRSHQPAIDSIRLAWEALPREQFETQSVTQVEANCLRQGLFRELVLELAETSNETNPNRETPLPSSSSGLCGTKVNS